MCSGFVGGIVGRSDPVRSKRVWIARVYALEGHDHTEEVLKIVHEEEQIVNVHVFRAIAGTGGTPKIYTSSLLTLSVRLPLIIEFFDNRERVERAISKLQTRLGLDDIVVWPARRPAPSQPPGGSQSPPRASSTDQ